MLACSQLLFDSMMAELTFISIGSPMTAMMVEVGI